MICPSVCPLDQAAMIAARTAALSLMIPLAKDATRLAFARSIQASSSSSSFFGAHGMESSDDASRVDEQRDAVFYRCDRYSL